MPAGKLTASRGVGSLSYLPYGINIRSMSRPYKKPGVKALDCQEIQDCRRYLRDAFKMYALDYVQLAPTATERRKTLGRIKNSAERLILIPNLPNAYALLSAMESRDYDALQLAYGALTAKGDMPFHQIKRRLLHWSYLSSVDREAIIAAARTLASLEVDALVPVSGRFPDPPLALLVTALVPVWERVTGREAAGLGTHYKEKLEEKRCLFADWLSEMHALMGLAAPSLWSVIDIVRRE
jgi:hypothetical protein